MEASSRRTKHAAGQQSGSEKFLQMNEIRRVWNAASFMVQFYGSIFTTTLTIRHSALKLTKSRRPSELISELARELRQRFDDPKKTGKPTIHWIYRYRTDEAGEQLTEFIINFDKRDVAKAQRWLAEKFFAVRHEGPVPSEAVVLEYSGTTQANHLVLVRWMCAAIQPDNGSAGLMSRLGIEARHNIELGNPFTARRIGLSHGLTNLSKQRASLDLRVLDAFKLAGRVELDWEMQEFKYRQDIQRNYLEHLRKIDEGAYSENRKRQLIAAWGHGEPARHSKRPVSRYS